MDKQLADYFRAQAEQLVQREYNNQSDANRKNIDKSQTIEINKLKSSLNSEWRKEDQIITFDLKQNMDKQLQELNTQIEQEYNEYDTKTAIVCIDDLSEDEICKDIDISRFPDHHEYEKAKRDKIREQKKCIRHKMSTRRKGRIKLSEYLTNRQNTETNKIKKEFNSEHDRVFVNIQYQRKCILQQKTNEIRQKWQKRENIKQESIDLKWKTQKESMIIKYTKKLIEKDKDRLISHQTSSLVGSVFDVNTIVDNRLTNEWENEKKEKMANKLKQLDLLIRGLHNQTENIWKKKINTEVEKLNINLNNELTKIDNISEQKYQKMRTEYQKKILDDLQNRPISIGDDCHNQDDYSKRLRDAQRSRQTTIREQRKKFRNSKYIPDELKSKIDLDKQTDEYKKKFLKNEYKHKIENYKRESEISMEKEIRVLTKQLKEKEMVKIKKELKELEKKWKECKKEESLLISKVKYGNQLETKILHLDSIITQKNTKILELERRNKELLRENSNYRKEVQDLQEKINSYAVDLEFITKFKNKYLISTNQVKLEEKIQREPKKITSVHRSQPIRKPQNKDELVEIMAKLLMKMTFRERGPIFQHKYIISGIYRKEADLDIIIKSKEKEVLSLKYNHFLGELAFKCGINGITLPYTFEKDVFFTIEFHFAMGKVTGLVNTTGLGTHELEDPILTNVVGRLQSKKSIFYHQYIDQL